MRIKVKTLRTLVFTGILAVGAIFAGGMISKKASAHRAYGEAEQDYCCGEIFFGTVNSTNSAASSSIDVSDIGGYCKSTKTLTYSDFDVTNGSKSFFTEASSGSNYNIKLGNSKAGGSFTINLKNNYKCKFLTVFVNKYASKDSLTFKVNGVSNSITTESYSESAGYAYNLDDFTNALTLESVNVRAYVSRITFQLVKF